MEPPTVINKYIDQSRNIVFEILAYRELTKTELLSAVRDFSLHYKVKNNKKYKIVTVIGHDGL